MEVSEVAAGPRPPPTLMRLNIGNMSNHNIEET